MAALPSHDGARAVFYGGGGGGENGGREAVQISGARDWKGRHVEL